MALLGVPTIIVWVPPLADLPAHLGRYFIQTDEGAAALRSYFTSTWDLSGNLGVDLLVHIAANPLGIELATRLVVASLPVLLGIGLLLVAKEIHGRLPPTFAVALPLTLGWPFQMGFVNYWLSVALAFLAFWLWMRMEKCDVGRKTRPWLFVLLGCVIWLAHTSGWALLGLFCFLHEFLLRASTDRSVAKRLIGALFACAPLTVPFLLIAIWRGADGAGIGGWFQVITKLQWFVGSLRDRWIVFDLFSLTVVMACIALPILWRGSAEYSRELFLAGIVLMFISISGPEMVFNSELAASRYFAVALALLVISVKETPGLEQPFRKILFLGAAAFCLCRIAGTIVSFQLYDQSYKAEAALMDFIAPRSRVAAFVGEPCAGSARNWQKARLEHFPSLVIIRRHAFVNNQFATFGNQPLLVDYRAAAPFLNEATSHVGNDLQPCDAGWPPLQSMLHKLPFGAFDYVWIINVPPALWPKEERLELLAMYGRSALYRIRSTRPDHSIATRQPTRSSRQQLLNFN